MSRAPSLASLSGRALATVAAGLLRRRWLVRAPIGLYRARLGFLFGSRLVMLEHTGRKSGNCRRVILEVVDHPRPGTYIVASGFGARAQWFRNVRAEPRVRVSVGARPPTAATARLLSGEEADAALTAYARCHPRSWPVLRPVFEATLGARIDTQEASLPMIALDVVEADPE